MTIRIIKFLDPEGQTATDVSEAWLNGHAICDRSLEGMPIRLFVNTRGKIDAEFENSDRHIFLKSVVKDAIEYGIDVDSLASTEALEDNDCVILDQGKTLAANNWALSTPLPAIKNGPPLEFPAA